jgi:predicted flap endonuclease-1-like 5' DNA nuclease
MLAIAGEIVIVVLAATAGAAAGWLLGRRGRDRVVATAREEATAGTLSLADDLYARTQRLHVVEARLARAQEQLAGRTGALAAATERVKAIENEAEVASREFAALEHERARLASRVAELVAECAASAALAGAACGEIDGWRARLGRAEQEFLALSARVAELEPMLDGLHRNEAALAEAASRLSAADSAAAERAREIERLEGALGMRESQLEGLRARIAVLEPLEAALAQREARIRELEAALPAPAPAMAPASPATRLPELPATARRKRAANGSQRDDLKRIPGIGPATERVLHSAGVYTFRQIANWRREDLEAITEKLGDSPARLKRDDWIAVARREHLKKYGEAP